MKIHYLRDFAGFLLIYALYAAVIVLMYGGIDIFMDDAPPMWPIWMLVGSLSATLVWYFLGEFVIRPNAPNITWYSTWFALVALILGWACFVAYNEFVEAPAQWNPYLHFIGGFFAFYISTVLFSPTFSKYRIWPARIVRKW